MLLEAEVLAVGGLLLLFSEGLGVGVARLTVVGGLIDLRDCLEVLIAFVVYFAIFGGPLQVRSQLVLAFAVGRRSINLLSKVKLVLIFDWAFLLLTFSLKEGMLQRLRGRHALLWVHF